MRKPYKSLAIGSPEGFDLAEKSIAAAAKSGTWVLLKNIHLAPQWLVQLEKKLHNLSPHQSFRLFMTSEIHPVQIALQILSLYTLHSIQCLVLIDAYSSFLLIQHLPANLLRQSHIFTYEPPPGVKANLQHTFAALPAARYVFLFVIFLLSI